MRSNLWRAAPPEAPSRQRRLVQAMQYLLQANPSDPDRLLDIHAGICAGELDFRMVSLENTENLVCKCLADGLNSLEVQRHKFKSLYSCKESLGLRSRNESLVLFTRYLQVTPKTPGHARPDRVQTRARMATGSLRPHIGNHDKHQMDVAPDRGAHLVFPSAAHRPPCYSSFSTVARPKRIAHYRSCP